MFCFSCDGILSLGCTRIDVRVLSSLKITRDYMACMLTFIMARPSSQKRS